MSYFPENALIIQSDRSVLLEVHSPHADAAREAIGDKLEVELRSICQSGQPFALRHYQIAAVAAFYQAGLARGGSGTIVLDLSEI